MSTLSAERAAGEALWCAGSAASRGCGAQLGGLRWGPRDGEQICWSSGVQGDKAVAAWAEGSRGHIWDWGMGKARCAGPTEAAWESREAVRNGVSTGPAMGPGVGWLFRCGSCEVVEVWTKWELLR